MRSFWVLDMGFSYDVLMIHTTADLLELSAVVLSSCQQTLNCSVLPSSQLQCVHSVGPAKQSLATLLGIKESPQKAG